MRSLLRLKKASLCEEGVFLRLSAASSVRPNRFRPTVTRLLNAAFTQGDDKGITRPALRCAYLYPRKDDLRGTGHHLWTPSP